MEQGQFFNAVADVATVTVEPDPGLAVSGSLVVARMDEPSVEGESILGGEKNIFILQTGLVRRELDLRPGEKDEAFFQLGPQHQERYSIGQGCPCGQANKDCPYPSQGDSSSQPQYLTIEPRRDLSG